MIIILDNAESIFDPQGADAAKIYALVEELSQLPTLCLCITSRIPTIPPKFETREIPTLPMDAACRTFYHIYKYDKPSNLVNVVLEQLDFHPLSITLLATVAQQNRWNADRLSREWKRWRTSMPQTKHNGSLAATIELSLASPMFQEFGPDARALLEIVAFFPQGVDENNVDRLFPTISNRADIFDGFCILSLAYRSNGFVTMLAPLRDYLFPKDPKTSPLLCATKENYFIRMSANLDPEEPDFGESRWIVSEDVNVEHLLNIFTSIDTNSDDVWQACSNFMKHLFWHKKRLTVLGPKIEGLPDDHFWKPLCLLDLAGLFRSVGNSTEYDRVSTHAHALELGRERGNDVGATLRFRDLSDSNWLMVHRKEGVQLAKEALGACERLGDVVGQGWCLRHLAELLFKDDQLDPAEEAASRAINLLPENRHRLLVSGPHLTLGEIYRSKGSTEKAIHHYKVVLRIMSSLNWQGMLFFVNYSLAQLFSGQGRFSKAQGHIEQVKSRAASSAFNLGRAMLLQAIVWNKQHRFKEAKSEALRATDVSEKIGDVRNLELCRRLLLNIQNELNNPVASGRSRFSCEFLRTVRSPARINFPS